MGHIKRPFLRDTINHKLLKGCTKIYLPLSYPCFSLTDRALGVDHPLLVLVNILAYHFMAKYLTIW